jgi:hypothetical protein
MINYKQLQIGTWSKVMFSQNANAFIINIYESLLIQNESYDSCKWSHTTLSMYCHRLGTSERQTDYFLPFLLPKSWWNSDFELIHIAVLLSLKSFTLFLTIEWEIFRFLEEDFLNPLMHLLLTFVVYVWLDLN